MPPTGSTGFNPRLGTSLARPRPSRRGPKAEPGPGANTSFERPGTGSRRLAIDALVRIEQGGAYANLVLGPLLDRSELGPADRRFVTELVYGATRMKRACDHLVDRFLLNEVEPAVRAALRIGAYQLAYLDTPPHAALDATVGSVPRRARSVVNAVLRRVAKAPVTFPDTGTELSYPDWMVERLTNDLGHEPALAALKAMNQRATTTVRDDGYVQDPASALVATLVGPEPGDLVLDLCAAPGGKATALVGAGARVVAADRRHRRVRLTAGNAERLGASLAVVTADGTAPPFRAGVADRVLIDAPCSGLGSLRRRPDARWRIDADAPERLARLQADLVVAGYRLLRPGGVLTYSVCTLTTIESAGVLDAARVELAQSADRQPEVLALPPEPWQAQGPVALLLPADTDGMTLFQLRHPG